MATVAPVLISALANGEIPTLDETDALVIERTSDNKVFYTSLSKLDARFGSAAPVDSVFGRTGAVTAAPGDYTASDVSALAIANDLSDLNSAPTARTNLGLAIGTDVQAQSAYLQDIADLSPGAGTDGYAVSWDNGTGAFVLSAAAGGGLSDVVDDTTPQLGGNLDVNGQSIVSVSNGDIAITPNGTGDVVLDGLKWPQADGTANYVLETDGAGQLGWVAQSGGGSSLPVADTTAIVKGSADATKLLRFEVDGFTTGTTRVMTPPNADTTLAGLSVAQTFTAAQTITGTFSVSGADSVNKMIVSKNDGSVVLQIRTDLSTPEVAIGSTAQLRVDGVMSFIGDSTGKFRVANSSSADVLAVNTTNRSVGVNWSVPFENVPFICAGIHTTGIDEVARFIGQNTGGMSAGEGISHHFQGYTSTGSRQSMHYKKVTWATATHATRQAKVDWTAYDYNAERTVISIGANGSAGVLGFYGTTPAAKQTVTGSRGGNAALASLLTALATLGLITDSSS